MHYACDRKWWTESAHDWRPGRYVKICGESGPQIREGVIRVGVSGDVMKFDTLFSLGGGGNSGFQCLNLMAQLGVSAVALVGFDMGGGGATHWHGPGWSFGGGTLRPGNMDRWRRVTDGAASVLHARGVEVVNTSARSALTAYRYQRLDKVLNEWRQFWKTGWPIVAA